MTTADQAGLLLPFTALAVFFPDYLVLPVYLFDKTDRVKAPALQLTKFLLKKVTTTTTSLKYWKNGRDYILLPWRCVLARRAATCREVAVQLPALSVHTRRFVGGRRQGDTPGCCSHAVADRSRLHTSPIYAQIIHADSPLVYRSSTLRWRPVSLRYLVKWNKSKKVLKWLSWALTHAWCRRLVLILFKAVNCINIFDSPPSKTKFGLCV